MNKLNIWLKNRTTDAAFSLQAGQLIRQGSVILSGIFLVKFRLSVGEIGVYETALYIGSAVSFFWLNAFIQGFTVFYPALTGENHKRSLWNIFILCSAVSAVLLTAIQFGNNFILKFLTGGLDLPLLRNYLWFLLFNLPASLLEIVLFLDRRPKKQLFYFIWSYGLQTLAIVMPTALGWRFSYSFYGLAVLGAFRYVYLSAYILAQAGRPTFSMPLLRSFWALCLPLIGYNFLSGFAVFFDGWLINFYYRGDPSVFAVFRYGVREFPLSLALSTGLSAAAAAMLSENVKSGLPELKRRAANLQCILFPVAIALVLFSKPLFFLIFNRSFSESAGLFSIYQLLVLSRVLFPQAVLLALKDSKGLLKISAAETMVNILLDALFIVPFGLKGIALSTAIAYLFEKVILTKYIKDKYAIDSSEYTDWRLYKRYTFLLTVAFLVSLKFNAIFNWSFLDQ